MFDIPLTWYTHMAMKWRRFIIRALVELPTLIREIRATRKQARAIRKAKKLAKKVKRCD